MPLTPPFKAIDQLSDASPPHPGEILREDMLPHYRVTIDELAERIGVSRQTLATIMAEQAPVTRDVAGRLGTAIGHGAKYWLALQLQYDMWHGPSRGGARAT